MLLAPPLKVDVEDKGDVVKVDASSGEGASISIFKREGGMPKAIASLPYRMFFLDVRSLTLEDMDVFSTLPGRGRSRLWHRIP